MKINLRLLHIYLAKIYPQYNLASIIKFLVHRRSPLYPQMIIKIHGYCNKIDKIGTTGPLVHAYELTTEHAQ